MATGAKRFILVEKKTVVITNFHTDILNFYKEHGTATFEPGDDLKDITMFSLHIYKAVHVEDLPVAISCEIDDTSYVLCVENNSVIYKKMKLPESISSETSEFIFYQKNCCLEAQIFESSIKMGFYLASSEDGRNLILKPYDIHAFDETTLISIEENVVFYENTYFEYGPGRGLPVIISCTMNEKNYLLCARSTCVFLKEKKLPKKINPKTSKFIFYKKNFSPGASGFCFDSSMNECYCFAWDESDPKKHLILKYNSGEDTDETMRIIQTTPDK
ncbi:interleukin-18-like isoform X2 [Engystomops pustulosus]|uniref:interleukin-18-like isoform X2 n=1 Tax=Engystomops pustulosus TaxID=76066 RepID=UPI003AFB74E5